jgi:hypothetical protein
MLLDGVQAMLIFRYRVENQGGNLQNEDVMPWSFFQFGRFEA